MGAERGHLAGKLIYIISGTGFWAFFPVVTKFDSGINKQKKIFLEFQTSVPVQRGYKIAKVNIETSFELNSWGKWKQKNPYP